MNRDELKDAAVNGRIDWQRHSLERMLERGIARQHIIETLTGGEVIEDYPETTPFPSALLLGLVHDAPLHVVAALDIENRHAYVITAYVPDLVHFEPGFRKRRST